MSVTGGVWHLIAGDEPQGGAALHVAKPVTRKWSMGDDRQLYVLLS